MIRINSGQPNDDSEAKKNKSTWQTERRRQVLHNEPETAHKYRATEPALKEDTKFSSILEYAKPQKLKQSGKDSNEEHRDEDRKDSNNRARETEASDNAGGGDRIERRHSSTGGQFGGAGNGFGGSGVNETINLSENFAARSILHIADLERMLSVVRSQRVPGGKREIYLELKRSVLKGLKVKISTDEAAQVQIEFFAADEKTRSQVENHTEDLANILRGRGVNLRSLRTTLDLNNQSDSDSSEGITEISNLEEMTPQSEANNLKSDNTFELSKD